MFGNKTFEDFYADSAQYSLRIRKGVLELINKECPAVDIPNGCPSCGGHMKDEWKCRWFRCQNDDCSFSLPYHESTDLSYCAEKLKDIGGR